VALWIGLGTRVGIDLRNVLVLEDAIELAKRHIDAVPERFDVAAFLLERAFEVVPDADETFDEVLGGAVLDLLLALLGAFLVVLKVCLFSLEPTLQVFYLLFVRRNLLVALVQGCLVLVEFGLEFADGLGL